MRVIVCDDTARDRDEVCSHVKRFFAENNCPVELSAYESGEALLADPDTLRRTKIAFLDIYMPGANGIDVAKGIRKTDEEMVIIFTTTSRDHGVDGYSVDALQYLLKPVDYAEVERVLSKCLKLFADSLRFISVLSERMTVRVYLKDIMHIEIFGHDLLIHTPSRTIKSRRSLDDIERELDGDSFLRTSRSFIVNMRYINDMSDNEFLMANGASVPISRNNKQAIKRAYESYAFELARRR
jgi:DNA-binding LytR/AlgR family response regulator